MVFETGNWSEVTRDDSDVFHFEKVGDTIEGKLVSVRQGQKYNNQIYEIETPKAQIMTVFGTTILDQRMQKVAAGSYVRIIYKGGIPTKKGKDAKDFAVFIRK